MIEQLELSVPEPPTLFDEWVHTAHGREVANKVIRLAMGLKKRGFRHYGIGAIVERVRWWMALKHGPDAEMFKINNNYRAGLARFAADRRPELEDFFRCRKQKNEDYMPRATLTNHQRGDTTCCSMP